MADDRFQWDIHKLEVMAKVLAIVSTVAGAVWAFCRWGLRWGSAGIRGLLLSDQLHSRYSDPVAVFERHTRETAAKIGEHDRAILLLLDHCGIAVYVCDADGQCIGVNRHLCELLGLSEDEAIGSGWTRALGPDAARVLTAWNETIETGAEYRVDYTVRYRDHTSVECESEAWRIEVGGEIVRYYGVVRRKGVA